MLLKVSPGSKTWACNWSLQDYDNLVEGMFYLIIWFLWEGADHPAHTAFSPQHWSWIDEGTEQISQVNKVRCLPASLQLIVWRVVSLMGWLKMCSVSPNNTETTTVSSAKYKWKYCYLLSLFIYLKDLWTFQFVMNLNKPNF